MRGLIISLSLLFFARYPKVAQRHGHQSGSTGSGTMPGNVALLNAAIKFLMDNAPSAAIVDLDSRASSSSGSLGNRKKSQNSN